MAPNKFSTKVKEITENVLMPFIGIGTANLKGQECIEIVSEGISLGYRHIDTADTYLNNLEIGEAIRRSGIKRDLLFITTKVAGTDLSKRAVIDSCKRALERMKIDHIDLFLVHWPNLNFPLEEPFEAMKELCDEKLIRAVGVSNYELEHIEAIVEIQKSWKMDFKIVNNQIEINPTNYPKGLIQFCFDHKITVSAYSPLRKGEDLELEQIQRIKVDTGVSESVIILSWLISKGIVPIVGTSNNEHLAENLKALKFKLSDKEIKALDSISDKS